MPLSSVRFAADPVLEACLAGNHRMLSGEQGSAVAKVQQALIDLGFSIPAGTTGQFGDQTGAAVSLFKASHGLSPTDPVVGSGTMGALDRAIVDFDTRRVQPQPSPVAANIEVVKFVVNAFIPRDVPGLTFPVTRGVHAGSTYIMGPPVPGPLLPQVPAVNPFLYPDPPIMPSISPPNPAVVCPALLTSGRGFSTSESRDPGHYKMHADVTIAFAGGPRIVDKALLAGRATQIDPTTGLEIQTEIASNSRMSLEIVSAWEFAPMLLPTSPGAFAVRVKLATAIPLIPGAALAGDIDLDGVFGVDADGRTAFFIGSVDRFPAFEAFVVTNGVSVRSLFQMLPVEGDTPLNLPGGPTRPIREFVGL